MSNQPHVIEVSEATFQKEVIQRSHEVPVLVDFWAAWCGPCRMLTPVLEGLAKEGGGRWILAKVNTDQNQQLSARYGIRGIPNVKAFRDGAVVDEFVGALPRPRVQAFLDKILPNAQDAQLTQATALIDADDYVAARPLLEGILAAAPDHDGANLALARVELAEGHVERALAHLDAIPARGPLGDAAQQLRARAHFAGDSASSLDELKAKVSANPDDWEQRFALAQAAVPLGDYAVAAEQFLAILQRDPQWQEGAARQGMLDLLTIMGEEDPRSADYRKRMSWLLFA